jgi:hypothetical protein
MRGGYSSSALAPGRAFSKPLLSTCTGDYPASDLFQVYDSCLQPTFSSAHEWRLSSLCPGSRYKVPVLPTFSSAHAWRLSIFCPGSRYRAVLPANTFYMHRRQSSLYPVPGIGLLFQLTFSFAHAWRQSSLCPGSRYKTLFYSLPFHLRMLGGYPASAMAPSIRLLFSAYLFICACVEAIQPLPWLQVELFSAPC